MGLILPAILSIVTTLLTLFVVWLNQRYSQWEKMGVPHERPELLYGNVRAIGRHDGKFFQRIYMKYKPTGSPFVGIFIYTRPAIVLTSIDLIRKILINDSRIFHNRGSYCNGTPLEPIYAHMEIIDGGAGGVRWKLLREKTALCFRNDKIRMMFSEMVEVTARFENKLGRISRSGAELEAKNLLSRFTMDIIGNCLLGIDFNTIEDENSEFYAVSTSLIQNARSSITATFLLLAYRDWAQILGVKTIPDEVAGFFTTIIRRTVRERMQDDSVRRNDFIEQLIELYEDDGDNHLTFDELLAQVYIFFITGFESTATTLGFCLYELALQPDIQTRARNCINEAIAKHNGELSYDCIMEMEYIDRVIKETFRLYPPLATVSRECDEDYRVPGTEFIIPKGTLVFVPVFAIHHDPEFYRSAEEFDPDNFTEENHRTRPSISFLPFGEGPRNCIASHFGMMLLRFGLVTALRKFHFVIAPRTSIPLQIETKSFITHPVDGIWFNVEAVD